MDTAEIVKNAFDDFTNDRFMDAKDKLRGVIQQKVADKLNTELDLEPSVNFDPEDFEGDPEE